MARPDEWALGMGLRVDGRPFSLEGREFVQQVIRDTHPDIVIPKAAQMSFTVTFLTRTLHWITQRRWHHLYLLPLKTGAIPFVQQRIDPVIDSNDALKREFQSVDNRLHKQSRTGVALYIRGTNIERELQEIPVDVEVWDERDRMVEDNLEDARARMDGSKVQKIVRLSTPTVPGHGVDSEDEWWASDQHRWEVPCPGCSRYQALNFGNKQLDYSNLKLGDRAEECVLECAYCKHEFTDEERWGLNKLGRWTAFNLGGSIRGYHISQFNSPTQSLVKIMTGYFKGQTNARKLKAFYNNKLGLPYVAAGDQLTPELLDKCRQRGYIMGGIPSSGVYIGIDIGTKIHVWCWHLGIRGEYMLWQLKIFDEWIQVDNFLSTLNSFTCVIDAHPEKRAARDIALKYHGRVWIGYEDDRPQMNEIANFHDLRRGEAGKVVIDRTMAFDTVIHDVMHGRVILPSDARELGEPMERKDYNGVYHQLIQMVRVEEENTRGTVVARWKKNKNPDHWHHALMFARIATLKKPSLVVPANISTAMGGRGFIGR